MSEIQDTPCVCRSNSASGIAGIKSMVGRLQTKPSLNCLDSLVELNDSVVKGSTELLIGFNLIDARLASIDFGTGNLHLHFEPFSELHETSPCVAESGAATPDAPALTVSENISAGAVSSSVPAHPRFVVIGTYVYDRELNRYTQFMFSGEAKYVLDLLGLHGDIVVGDYKWEDAK